MNLREKERATPCCIMQECTTQRKSSPLGRMILFVSKIRYWIRPKQVTQESVISGLLETIYLRDYLSPRVQQRHKMKKQEPALDRWEFQVLVRYRHGRRKIGRRPMLRVEGHKTMLCMLHIPVGNICGDLWKNPSHFSWKSSAIEGLTFAFKSEILREMSTFVVSPQQNEFLGIPQFKCIQIQHTLERGRNTQAMIFLWVGSPRFRNTLDQHSLQGTDMSYHLDRRPLRIVSSSHTFQWNIMRTWDV